MKFLAIDFGDSRTGFAVSDTLGFSAHTLDAYKEKNFKKVAEYAVQLCQEHSVEKIILGFPKNMNGTIGPRGEKTKRFANYLKTLTGIPVILWDERLTTVSAHQLMNETNVYGKKRKARVDSISAAYILQGYLDSLR